MGFNTSVVVLNDALDQIAKDEKFGEKLASAITSASIHEYRGTHIMDVSAGNHGNAATVIASNHADVKSIVCVGGNVGTELVAGWGSELDIIKQLAEKHGYRLVKKIGKR